MSRPSVYWAHVESRRRACGLSRAALARRAGISESTIYKGLHGGTRPEKATRAFVELVLAMEERLRGRGRDETIKSTTQILAGVRALRAKRGEEGDAPCGS